MRRLPVFAELASPSTPAATAGVVGCVMPIPIGPLGSPIDAALRRSDRERVLEARVAMLKQRLTQALREHELLKAVPAESRGALCALLAGSVNVRRTGLRPQRLPDHPRPLRRRRGAAAAAALARALALRRRGRRRGRAGGRGAGARRVAAAGCAQARRARARGRGQKARLWRGGEGGRLLIAPAPPPRTVAARLRAR
jgi:hypothetical protein